MMDAQHLHASVLEMEPTQPLHRRYRARRRTTDAVSSLIDEVSTTDATAVSAASEVSEISTSTTELRYAASDRQPLRRQRFRAPASLTAVAVALCSAAAMMVVGRSPVASALSVSLPIEALAQGWSASSSAAAAVERTRRDIGPLFFAGSSGGSVFVSSGFAFGRKLGTSLQMVSTDQQQQQEQQQREQPIRTKGSESSGDISGDSNSRAVNGSTKKGVNGDNKDTSTSAKKSSPLRGSGSKGSTKHPPKQQKKRWKKGSKGQNGRRKYQRQRPLPASEKAAVSSRRNRQQRYEAIRSSALKSENAPPSMWSFDGLFANPVWDKDSVDEDLYGSKRREEEVEKKRKEVGDLPFNNMYTSEKNGEEMVEPLASSAKPMSIFNPSNITTKIADAAFDAAVSVGVPLPPRPAPPGFDATTSTDGYTTTSNVDPTTPMSILGTVDRALTRMVQDRINGVRREPSGDARYATSLLPADSAISFREGVRLGKPLAINLDRLCHFAKKDFRKGRLEEAQESYEEAVAMDPTDGRPYLGLSRVAQRRGDVQQGREWLRAGIQRSTGGYVTVRNPVKKNDNKNKKRGGRSSSNNGGALGDWDDDEDDDGLGDVLGTIPDDGPNPFLLQALGTLEQKTGSLAAAEELYLAALRSRPSHAAAWVSLAQLRTRKLRQGAPAGRACYLSAEREWKRIGAKPNAHVYTAWADLENKKGGDIRRARELFQKALEVDPRCSAALLQLGVMESDRGNFDEAEECFERVLKFDQRNSRVLQAYAIMESRRPEGEKDSRMVLDLFERALKVNPRDAGVLQAYGLYVVELGDVDSGRDLLRKGTEVDKRHAPAWQAWGVLETRYGTARAARDVFQRGIWACAQGGGGQSGGRRCARLWQAWGVLEAREGDHKAARRCFSRALDADNRNVAAVTAWTKMEEELGNAADARSIFERTLKQFPSASDDKTAIWRAFEIMEERTRGERAAQLVFKRSMREAIASKEVENDLISEGEALLAATVPRSTPLVGMGDVRGNGGASTSKRKNNEVEVSLWTNPEDEEGNVGDMDAEVWMNNGSIEGKVPAKTMKKMRTQGDKQGTGRR